MMGVEEEKKGCLHSCWMVISREDIRMPHLPSSQTSPFPAKEKLYKLVDDYVQDVFLDVSEARTVPRLSLRRKTLWRGLRANRKV